MADELPPDEVLRLSVALDDQIKALVRTEQQLFASQRDLRRRNARLVALNRFALVSADLDEPVEILAHAADVLLNLFSLDVAVGFLASEGGFIPISARAAEGATGGTARAIPASCAEPVDADLSATPVVEEVGAIRRRPGPARLLTRVEAIFADEMDRSRADPPASLAVVLPLAREGGVAVGAIVLRRLSAAHSFHVDLPTSADVAFLEVVAGLVAARVTHARMVRDLKASHAELAMAQSDLVARERLAALGEFAAIVAHEVRNPLGAIFNVVSILRKEIPEGQASVLLEVLREESVRLDRMVTDLLEFARPNASIRRPELSSSIVEGAVDSVRASLPGAAITIVTSCEPPVIRVDPRMVHQALVNLIQNAVQASEAGAPVFVRVAIVRGELSIAVEDRGSGVPEPVASRIFEPFFTTKAHGTGLGLPVVKRVADAHGGSVSVSPRAGGGTVFTLRLPIDADPGTPSTQGGVR